MSRRYPKAGALSEPRKGSELARHRWAASLGPAPDQALLPDAPDTGTTAEGPADWAGSDWAGSDGAGSDAAGLNGATESPTPAAYRWRSSRRAAALLAVVSVLLAGWFWWQAADGAPRVQALGSPPGPEAVAGSAAGVDVDAGPGGLPATADPAAADLPVTTAPGSIVVHVAGAVARAGVVRLPRGSRIHEAIKAAGGSTRAADLDRLNLAAILEDGQQVLVPERGSPDLRDPPGPSTNAGGTGSPGGAGTPSNLGAAAGKINLNTASVEELATLPRVGPVLAQRIVDWRKQHGNFGRAEELDAVEGIGPKLLEALLPLVRV